MTHPNQTTLALYAGQDLGWFTRVRTRRHLAGCGECRDAVQAFASARGNLVALCDLPALSWNRMAIEMKANIRLGLAAGECVRGERRPLALFEMLSGARTLVACASVMVLVSGGSIPAAAHAARAACAAAGAGDGAVLRTTANGIELNQGGQTWSLLHVRSADVTYSAGAQGFHASRLRGFRHGQHNH